LGKVCAAARALAVLLAIVFVFYNTPYAATILIVLGAIAALNNAPEDSTRVYMITIVLFLIAKSVAVVPMAGATLATIFSNLDMGLIGASLVSVVLGLYARIRGDWMPGAA
jgi:hypothetical protein